MKYLLSFHICRNVLIVVRKELYQDLLNRYSNRYDGKNLQGLLVALLISGQLAYTIL